MTTNEQGQLVAKPASNDTHPVPALERTFDYDELYDCAECGHQHFTGWAYVECPIRGCKCKGQEWAIR